MPKSVCRIGALALVLVAVFAATDLSATASSKSCSAKLSKKSTKAVHFALKCNFDIKKVQGKAVEAGGGGSGWAYGCKSNSSKTFTCTLKKSSKSYTGTFQTYHQLCDPELQLDLSINGGTVKKQPLAKGCASGQY